MKILHITVVRNLSKGQYKQLLIESKAANNLENSKWDLLVYHDHSHYSPFIKQIPLIFRNIIFRKLFVWFLCLKYTKFYDYILVRHSVFDPFGWFFSIFIKNRITIHHSKEVEELHLIRKGIIGNIAAFLEKVFGTLILKNNIAIIGVTNEIANYQNLSRGLCKKTFIYPNGYNFETSVVIRDKREKNKINAFFICGKFSDWHGLDLIFESFLLKSPLYDVKIHLVGELLPHHLETLKNVNISKYFQIHGSLNYNEYKDILEICDISIGSFGLFRKGLKEACTLKVRELLSYGLPVYSGHLDSSLNSQFMYYYYDTYFNIDNFLNYAFSMKNTSREDIRKEASLFLNKEKIMSDLIGNLHTLSELEGLK